MKKLSMLCLQITEKRTLLISSIVNLLQQGEVVLLPFDTSYGLAVDASNREAVKKIYLIKQREHKKALSVVMRDLKMLKRYVVVGAREEKMIEKYLPGPFTLVLKLLKNHPLLFTSLDSPRVKESLAIRIPDFWLTKKISQKFPWPYTATSANLSGENPCYNIQDFFKQIGSRKKFLTGIVDGGELPRRKVSQIIDLTQPKIKILRR